MENFGAGIFVGEFRHALDAKGRLTIPSTWRFAEETGNEQYLALPNLDGHITVYGPEMIAQLKANVAKMGMADREGQRALGQIMAKAQLIVPDKAGRINLNTRLIAHCGLEKEAVLLGKITSFSIYSAAGYDVEEITDHDALADALSRFGL